MSMERWQYVRLLSAVYASMFLIRLAFGISVVTFAVYLEDSGDLLYSLVVTASPFVELLTVPYAGALSDRYGRKGVLLAGLGLGAVSLYALALTKNPLLLSFANALHGAAAALILVTTLAFIASVAPAAHRGREMGYFNLANIFGWIAGFAVGGLMLDAFEARLEYTFVIAGALATLGLMYANRMLRLPSEGSPPGHGSALREFLDVAKDPRILLLSAPWLIVYMLVAPFITFFPRVASGVLDISGGQTAIGILVVGGLFVVSQVFWGRLADKYGRETIMLTGAVGFALLMGVIVYAFFETSSTDAQAVFDNVASRWPFLVGFLFLALAFAPAGLAAIADEAKEGAQGATMSTYSLTLSLGFILGPPVVGIISERFGGRGMVLYFAALAAGLLALVLTRFVQRLGRAAFAG